MSSKMTTPRLVVSLLLVSLLNIQAGIGALFAQETGNDLCSEAPLTLNETFDSLNATAGPSGIYTLELPGSGVLSIYVSNPLRLVGASFPKLSLIENECQNDVPSNLGHELISETPQSLLLWVRDAQTIRIAVMPEDPATALGPFKLQVAFAEDVGTPDAILPVGVNPPESCAVTSAPPLGEDPFQADRFVVLERDVDMTRDIEPEDCDILDGMFADPGVVIIDATGTPLDASFYAGHECTLQNIVGGGLLTSPDSAVAIPVHEGPYRLALDPMSSEPVAYSLNVRHFDLCRLGEPDDHGSLPLCASPLDLGSTATGVIEEVIGGDEDFFTFSLEELATVVVEVTGAVTLTIYDKKGQRVSVKRADISSETLRVVRTLGQGRHYLGVSGSPNVMEPYAITLQESIDP